MQNRALGWVVAGALGLVAACGPGPELAPDCTLADDCGSRAAAVCAVRCAAPATSVCVAGQCEVVTAARASVLADVMVSLSLSGQVRSIVFTFVDQRQPAADSAPVTCADLKAGAPAASGASANAVASGFANLVAASGATYFPGTNLGAVPVGRYLLEVVATTLEKGAGDEVARICLDPVEVADPMPKLSLTLKPDG